MGLLVGEAKEILSYSDSRKHQHLLKSNAAKQLAKLLSMFATFEKDETEQLKFGTELEVHLLSKRVVEGETYYPVYLDSKSYMKLVRENYKSLGIQEEFAAWMVELLPETPFSRFLDFSEIRRHFCDIDKLALDTRTEPILVSGLSVLPHIGTLHYHIDENDAFVEMEHRRAQNPYSQSDCFIDGTITNHSRFKSFTMNCPMRRQRQVNIRMPVFQDSKTTAKEVKLDHFGFGMCNTALQITYSCKNLTQARIAHDLMHIISPFVLVFSGSVFALNGRLIDSDCRFEVIQQSTDDRSPREMLKIEKGRYGLVNYFLSNDKKCKDAYNDKKYTINKTFQKDLWRELKKYGSPLSRDKRLINHFAYLFVREYLVVFKDRIVPDNIKDTIEFEIIQSSNWQNMRIKPPGSFDSSLGWLLEFRCMDSPITEREKTSLVFMTTLFMRIVTDEKLDVNFYVPISTVDKNYVEAFKRDSILQGRFIFRRNFCPLIEGFTDSEETVLLTMAEFWQGNQQFAGMRRLFEKFIEVNKPRLLQESSVSGQDQIQHIWRVYDFFLARAKGELMTTPQYFRKFIRNHPEYAFDSVLNPRIIADVIEKILQIQAKNYLPELFGDFNF
jgi:glutamate--cysteine ligase catalytic subunit